MDRTIQYWSTFWLETIGKHKEEHRRLGWQSYRKAKMAWYKAFEGHRVFSSALPLVNNQRFIVFIDRTSVVSLQPPMPRLDHMRCYPLLFGLKVADLMPYLLEDCQVPECPPEANGKEIFQSMKYDDLWEDASLSECCVYVRGLNNSKFLLVGENCYRYLGSTLPVRNPSEWWFYSFLMLFWTFQNDQKKQAIYGHIWPYMVWGENPYP